MLEHSAFAHFGLDEVVTCREVSSARRASLVVVPLSFARCSAAERAPETLPCSRLRDSPCQQSLRVRRETFDAIERPPHICRVRQGDVIGIERVDEQREFAFASAHCRQRDANPSIIDRNCHSTIMTVGCDNYEGTTCARDMGSVGRVPECFELRSKRAPDVVGGVSIEIAPPTPDRVDD